MYTVWRRMVEANISAEPLFAKIDFGFELFEFGSQLLDHLSYNKIVCRSVRKNDSISHMVQIFN